MPFHTHRKWMVPLVPKVVNWEEKTFIYIHQQENNSIYLSVRQSKAIQPAKLQAEAGLASTPKSSLVHNSCRYFNTLQFAVITNKRHIMLCTNDLICMYYHLNNWSVHDVCSNTSPTARCAQALFQLNWSKFLRQKAKLYTWAWRMSEVNARGLSTLQMRLTQGVGANSYILSKCDSLTISLCLVLSRIMPCHLQLLNVFSYLFLQLRGNSSQSQKQYLVTQLSGISEAVFLAFLQKKAYM